MKNGQIWGWFVLVDRPGPGLRWTAFRSRFPARMFAYRMRGEIFKLVRSH
ncbi:MAG: hypothetical protein ACREPQ_09740 [Rhodanobacter sp.]